MSRASKSALSFYRSGEFRPSKRGALLVTAGRCTCTTTSTCVACVEVVIDAN